MMKLFVTKVNGFQQLNFVKMSFILYRLVVPDTPLFRENELKHPFRGFH